MIDHSKCKPIEDWGLLKGRGWQTDVNLVCMQGEILESFSAISVEYCTCPVCNVINIVKQTYAVLTFTIEDTGTHCNLQNPVRANVCMIPMPMQDKINLVSPQNLFTVSGYIRYNLHMRTFIYL